MLADLIRGVAPSGDALAIGRAFQDAWERARAAHPTVDLDGDSFAHHLAHHLLSHLKRRPGADVSAVLGSIHSSDLYLALGCGLGDPAAIASFEASYLREAPAFVAHVGLAPNMRDEFLQTLRARILAPHADGAKILRYSGQGPLGGWLRVSAVRLALTLRAQESRHSGDSDNAVAIASVEPDPELLLARQHSGQAFKTAFELALASIEPDERTALRMHYVDGLTLDQMGVACAVHRATAARWLASGRARLAALTRKNLRESLKLEQAEMESVLRLVDNDLELSLCRVLGPSSTDDPPSTDDV